MEVITFINAIKSKDQNLPKSYLQFINTYGYGIYCGIVNITEPDEQVIHNNFSDYNFWEFNSKFTNDDFKNTIKLASTIDGDIICSVKNKDDTIFILPRDSETILSFNNLNDVFFYYKEIYQISKLYFQPSFGRKVDLFSLINNERLLDIEIIHQKFLKNFEYDFIIEKEQSKYVIRKIGGWINFDLVYKNSISVSYQLIEKRDNEHTKYIDFIKKEIKQLKTLYKKS